MSPETRQKAFLAALLAVLLVFGGGRLKNWLTGLGAAELFGRGSRAPDVSRVLNADIAELADVRGGLRGEVEPGRNPFVYGRPPAPPAPPPPPKPRDKPVRQPTRPAVPIKPIEEPASAVTATKRPPPEIDFEYLGSFGPSGRRIAVLETEDSTINAMRGDEIRNGNFQVHAIGFESIDVTFPGHKDAAPQRVPLKGLEP